MICINVFYYLFLKYSKYKMKSLVKISVFFFCMLFFVGCARNYNEREYRIGVSQCSGGAWRDKMNDEMRRELLFHSEIGIEFKNAEDNIAQQIKDIEYYISENVDLLVVSPADSTSLTPVIAKAYDSGIPVIVADRRVVGDKFSSFIGGDNEAIGHEMADYAIEKLGKSGGSIIEIKGTAGSTPVTLRHKGFIDGLANHDNIRIIASVDGNWNRSKVQKEIAPLLKLHPEVDMIIAQNDAMALDAIHTADSLLQGNHILFMGADGLPLKGQGLEAIEEGKLDATAVYPTGGDAIIQTAAKILKNEPYETNIILGTYLINTVKQANMLNEMARAENHEVETIQMLKDRVDYYWELNNLQKTFLWTLFTFVVLFGVLTGVLFYLLKQRTMLTQKLKQASQAKLSFFTGVSHDFRTPLTLISGPISSLAIDESLNDRQKLLVQIAEKNTRVLLRLINQVLDFRKYESGKLELNLSSVDLMAAEKEWFDAFNGLARKRHITLTNNISQGDYHMMCDVQKLERVFFNIVGNAFKYTPENGYIDVSLSRSGTDVVLRIADSGPGIPDDKKDKVFDDFYTGKLDSSAGSGIGLAVVKSFVELHNGSITIHDNERGSGTVINIIVPLIVDTSKESMLKDYSSQSIETSSMAQINAEILSTKNAETELSAIEEHTFAPEDEERPIMLIIDDNTDIITFLKFQFEYKYKIFTAQDGVAGIQKALQLVPDIIICDLMMPRKNGVEVCTKLRNEVATCHIPIIMLTACSIDEQRVKSHEGGADAYITKPFSLDVLQAQVDVLISNRKRLIEKYCAQNEAEQERARTVGSSETQNRREQILSSMDAEFMEKLNRLINKNLSNSKYGVEILSEDMELSRSQLFRKVKALTDVTPLELIRNARLEKGRELIMTTKDDIAIIAAKVGFNTPSYFTKCYKEYFGELPNNVSC